MKEFSRLRLQHQAVQMRQQKAARERRMRRLDLTPDPNLSVAAPASRGNSVDEDTLKKDPLALIRREIAVMKKLEYVALVSR
jgi:hypothetical protein